MVRDTGFLYGRVCANDFILWKKTKQQTHKKQQLKKKTRRSVVLRGEYILQMISDSITLGKYLNKYHRRFVIWIQHTF